MASAGAYLIQARTWAALAVAGILIGGGIYYGAKVETPGSEKEVVQHASTERNALPAVRGEAQRALEPLSVLFGRSLQGLDDAEIRGYLWSLSKPAPSAPVQGEADENPVYGARESWPSISLASAPDIQAIIAKYEWPQETALAIAWCESRYDPLAVNGIHIGLYQISLIHRWSGDWLLVAENNVAAAHALYVASGWEPWASSRGCWG